MKEEKNAEKNEEIMETEKQVHTNDEILGKSQPAKVNRRSFLSRAAALGALGAGFLAFPNLLGKDGTGVAQITEIFDCFGCELTPLMGSDRAEIARKIRFAAANYEYMMPIPSHPCNGDEKEYSERNYFASYTKGIRRADGPDGKFYGEVNPVDYCTLLKALHYGDPEIFEAVRLGASDGCGDVFLKESAARLAPNAFEANKQRRLESPQAGLNFDLEGKDYHQLVSRLNQIGPIGAQPVAFPKAPNFTSKEAGTEIVEVYWQALTRDVPFRHYNQNTLVQKAADDLTTFAQYYTGPVTATNQVTPQLYSRGVLKGDTTGPFISQFLLRDIPYGAQVISAKINSPVASRVNDFMMNRLEWLKIQTGRTPDKTTTFGTRRFIRSGRDLAEYVHNDAIYQAYLNAALILMTPKSVGGLEVPVNPHNPYRPDNPNMNGYCKQLNFVEFGPSQLLSLLGEVSVRAHKAVWYQKWNVHRRLRPEEYGGRIFFSVNGQNRYPISSIVEDSTVLDTMLGLGYESVLLPQAFPEGSPLHPAYGAGHATLAGAAVTILKAWFDSERSFELHGQMLESNETGTALQQYISAGADTNITIADELNKLASNIALGRDIAGVHWRSDYTESVFLGEQVAIQLLEDWGYTYNEEFDGFTFRGFDGAMVTNVGKKRTL